MGPTSDPFCVLYFHFLTFFVLLHDGFSVTPTLVLGDLSSVSVSAILAGEFSLALSGRRGSAEIGVNK